MRINVALYNGTQLELDGDLSIEQIREVLTASGVANLSGAPAVERVAENGVDRTVEFSAPTGTTKG